MTYAVNGVFNGYDHRLDLLKRAMKVLCNNQYSTDYLFKNSRIYNIQKASFGWGLWHDPDSFNSGCKKDQAKSIEGYVRFTELYDSAGKPAINGKWYGHKGSELPEFVKNKLDALKVVV